MIKEDFWVVAVLRDICASAWTTMGRPWNTGLTVVDRTLKADQARLISDGSIHLNPNEAREVDSSIDDVPLLGRPGV